MTQHTATIDVTTNNGRTFYRTLRYSYCPLFSIKFDEFMTWDIDRLPSLKWRKDAVLFVKFPDGSEYEIKLNQKKVKDHATYPSPTARSRLTFELFTGLRRKPKVTK